jgi:DNA-binding response OmpR family regulator
MAAADIAEQRPDVVESPLPDRLLLVTDDDSLAIALQAALTQELFSLVTVQEPAELLAIRQERPSLVLVGLVLHRLRALDVVRRVRQVTDVPIVVLSSRDDEMERVVALEVGADDYVAEPYTRRALTACIRAHLRRQRDAERGPAHDARVPLREGAILVSFSDRRVWRGSTPIALNRREFDLLGYFLEQRGIVLSRRQLLENVWGTSMEFGARTVDSQVRRLRAKIEDESRAPEYLHTFRGLGYLFRYQPRLQTENANGTYAEGFEKPCLQL